MILRRKTLHRFRIARLPSSDSSQPRCIADELSTAQAPFIHRRRRRLPRGCMAGRPGRRYAAPERAPSPRRAQGDGCTGLPCIARRRRCVSSGAGAGRLARGLGRLRCRDQDRHQAPLRPRGRIARPPLYRDGTEARLQTHCRGRFRPRRSGRRAGRRYARAAALEAAARATLVLGHRPCRRGPRRIASVPRPSRPGATRHSRRIAPIDRGAAGTDPGGRAPVRGSR